MERGEGGGFTWGGVEGWGEKAYNCNCITIKKIKKKYIKYKIIIKERKYTEKKNWETEVNICTFPTSDFKDLWYIFTNYTYLYRCLCRGKKGGGGGGGYGG